MAEPAGIARDQLKSIVERIERLNEEKKALSEDIKEVYAEAKANGFDTKTLRTVIRLRAGSAPRSLSAGARHAGGRGIRAGTKREGNRLG